MFHSFDSRRSPSASAAAAPTLPRKVNRSCQECTRRKVKCDGGHPCASCQYYKVADSCEYRQRSRRHAVSRSTLEKTAEKLRDQSRVLQELFPDVSVDDLLGKSRAELLALLPRDSLSGTRPAVPQAGLLPAGVVSTAAPEEDGNEDEDDVPDDPTQLSESGEAANDRRWEESAHQPTTIRASDDINAVSLATDQHHSSYLGVTSVSAVLRAIFRLCPAAKEHTAQRVKTWNDAQNQSQLLPSLSPAGAGAGQNPLRERRCIVFYFDHVHPITPILNEDDFRRTLASGARHDGSWLALLNMVFTLGSVASGSDSLHLHYYKQARAHLDIDFLGSGNMESLQALCLLGGYYLHYRNSPNMAYAVLGAAHRVAIALGLHREPAPRSRIADERPVSDAERDTRVSRAETRRRTWWGLFCLDTWASMTLGRPTCGRWDGSTMDTLLPASLFPDDHVAASLRASCMFCHICDRIQHRFAQHARLSAQEALAFDRELREWHASLPEYLRDPANSPPRLAMAREFMRNRYLSVRLILSRCFLLYLAQSHGLRRGAASVSSIAEPSAEDMMLVDICRSVALEAIDAITLYWMPNRIHVWNSAWYLFQACMVPLLSIAIETRHRHSSCQQERPAVRPIPSLATAGMPPVAPLATWCAGLTKALEVFAEMRPWMRTSDYTPEIVAALYEAVTAEIEEPGAAVGPATRTPSATTDGSMDLFEWCDEQLAELDWGTYLGVGGEDGMHQRMFAFF
ncbi:fungal specific transcription factor domain-containing protein [Colletotrichum graminicola]|uniref:Fungal specific transcription factor domain-containing protein n=1 Tax=Colletotrichum graminicola (strain M1.001 / M2 / FGSC 10212) TaxID=645133 RepID=E3QIJ4_COLGM|nr:fungal specific transcription factor domain-containing protein [Colletotrichum graminicola M1.001]EFQ30604.1 fungal specific transcription factor domain-containing protein [Colletotrichum graminicola M1.001]WDK21329.1 fungal specific transcription factor domain-containing protein [Colletotrichum graminicola]